MERKEKRERERDKAKIKKRKKENKMKSEIGRQGATIVRRGTIVKQQ